MSKQTEAGSAFAPATGYATAIARDFLRLIFLPIEIADRLASIEEHLAAIRKTTEAASGAIRNERDHKGTYIKTY